MLSTNTSTDSTSEWQVGDPNALIRVDDITDTLKGAWRPSSPLKDVAELLSAIKDGRTHEYFNCEALGLPVY